MTIAQSERGAARSGGRAEATDAIEAVLLAYDGVDALDLFGVHAVLAKASAVPAPDGGARLCVVIAAASRVVTTSCGVELACGATLDALERAHAIVVPGGRGAADAARQPSLAAPLARAHARGAAIYAVCSGALIVAASGVANGRRLAIHRDKRQSLRDVAPSVEPAVGLVADGRLCSVGGDASPSAKATDLAFQLLADVAPYAVAPVAARMELRPGRGAAAARLLETAA
ncbi:short-chain dehydrogenase [Burkholderia sp. ABCPW 14]|uniref:DJ-1/PfpI family protein n=1 Tax=Burkholderia sp. ABCPW 14 TaxID=1637860 RepID=UPI000770D374|nr:DJ-1/PfpI family protein [Burkholderia sp. ABCPW 14]KVD87340.1 short-chain dehydrogenase [Burkholderia sp. ABCPW 14]